MPIWLRRFTAKQLIEFYKEQEAANSSEKWMINEDNPGNTINRDEIKRNLEPKPTYSVKARKN